MTEMIPTCPRKKRSEPAEPSVPAQRVRVGLRKILDWAGRESGIDKDLQACFSLEDALTLSSIARYWVATDGDALPLLNWDVEVRSCKKNLQNVFSQKAFFLTHTYFYCIMKTPQKSV